MDAPAIAAATVTNSATTTSQRFSLVSSSGQVVDSSSLNQTKTVSIGSSGAAGRPEASEALGADTMPLTDTELATIKTTTPTAAARIINESILGFDSRFHVNPYGYPQRAVSLITYNGSTHCTGWLVSADTLVTAGHCVHSGGANGRWGSPSAFKIYPASLTVTRPTALANLVKPIPLTAGLLQQTVMPMSGLSNSIALSVKQPAISVTLSRHKRIIRRLPSMATPVIKRTLMSNGAALA
ncbi:trypsin-like serine protease [Thiothrix subterranea]|uniref:trypsin-like serine protease n=1 Tax=Thiothrix subterranea TaxID=2735563 RepID=UPI00280A55E8|nr:trypsin-like serine protease [Thiothrix subterranea]